MDIDREIESILRKANRERKTITQSLLEKRWWQWADIPYNHYRKRKTPCAHFRLRGHWGCELESHSKRLGAWEPRCSTDCPDYEKFDPSLLQDTYCLFPGGSYYHIVEFIEPGEKVYTLCHRSVYEKNAQIMHDRPEGYHICSFCASRIPETTVRKCHFCARTFEEWQMTNIGTLGTSAEKSFVCPDCGERLYSRLYWNRGRLSKPK